MNIPLFLATFSAAMTICIIAIGVFVNLQISRYNRMVYHAVSKLEHKYHHGYLMVIQLGPNRKPAAYLFSPEQKIVAVGQGDNTLHAIIALEASLRYEPPKGEPTPLILPPIQKGKYNGKA